MPGGSQQGAGSAGGAGGIDGIGSTDELDELFEKSLGDFDGVLGEEREGMASTGQGSGRGAGQRETGDAEAVAGAASRGGYGGGVAGGSAGSGADMPSGGSMGGGMDGAGSAGTSGDQSASNSEAGGGGQNDKPGEFEGSDIEETDRKVAKLPEDIPIDGSADDQVARQIREAAMAEQDPIIREALWDEYRKHMGIKKK